jgi:hypothetical protein
MFVRASANRLQDAESTHTDIILWFHPTERSATAQPALPHTKSTEWEISDPPSA